MYQLKHPEFGVSNISLISHALLPLTKPGTGLI